MKPKFISRKTLAAGAAEAWRKQYAGEQWDHDADKSRMLWRLLDLGSNPSPDDVERVIGNTSWTREPCSACRNDIGPWVQVGQETHYESATAILCKACVLEALAVFEPERGES